MRLAVDLILIALLAPLAARAGEIVPRTVARDSSSYSVTLHVDAVQDATSKYESLLADAKAAIGEVVSVESGSTPRAGRGYDVTYKFMK